MQDTIAEALKAEKDKDLQTVTNLSKDINGILNFYNNREAAIARTRLEECIMWAAKGITQ